MTTTTFSSFMLNFSSTSLHLHFSSTSLRHDLLLLLQRPVGHFSRQPALPVYGLPGTLLHFFLLPFNIILYSSLHWPGGDSPPDMVFNGSRCTFSPSYHCSCYLHLFIFTSNLCIFTTTNCGNMRYLWRLLTRRGELCVTCEDY